ncbi:MAG TPA: aspartate aminotransferase family protein [Candidatus Acidoferrum sp.]|nr:aspartate aminotransferase family protein [Candidatus Acidoferrum sp.]
MNAPARAAALFGAGPLPKVAWGKGSYVYDTAGKRYIDGSCGPAVYCIGHGNEEVNAAIGRQLDKIAHGYRYTFTSDPLEELTEIVKTQAGNGLERMVFVTGGSEATESCLKIALQYHAARGEMSRRRFIARERSWHGNTLGALSVSGFKERRAPFEGALLDVSHLSPVNAYRPPANVRPDDVARACADELEQEILRVGPDKVAAFIFEPVVGAAGGAVPAPPGYARAVREICDRHGVLLIADEVMCGTGRCGTWRALEHDGVVPDIMAIAKGLAGGYLPLGAAVYHRKVAEPILAVHGAALTGHTFSGHTACCAAGVAVQTIIKRENLVQRVHDNGAKLTQMLRTALHGVDAVGDIRGRGHLIGIEFVADRQTSEPFRAELQLFARIRQTAFDDGLICYPVGGNVDGVNGDIVIIAPPYNATDDELAEIVDKFGHAARKAVAAIGRG